LCANRSCWAFKPRTLEAVELDRTEALALDDNARCMM
jgi:hypothetical protein